MPSALASLLARDGVVDLVDLERAFQTQVLHGGTLDTALLELGTVSQTQIIKYLSMANGLPGSTGPLEVDDDVASTVTADTASSYGVVPLEIKDNELTVLVRDDIALEDLNALSKKLSLSVRPLVTTELNFLETRHRLYSTDLSQRFQAISNTAARSTENNSPVIWEAPDVRIGANWSATAAKTGPKKDKKAPKTVSQRKAAASAEKQQAKQDDVATEEKATSKKQQKKNQKTQTGARTKAKGTAKTKSTPKAETKAETKTKTTPKPKPEESQKKLTTDDAFKKLEALVERASHRDEIFSGFLELLASKATYSAVLVLKKGFMVGHTALENGRTDTKLIKEVSISIEKCIGIRHAVTTNTSFIGSLATDDPEIDDNLLLLGGTIPTSAFVLPITVGKRVLAVGLAHSPGKTLTTKTFSPLIPGGDIVAQALLALIKRQKIASTSD